MPSKPIKHPWIKWKGYPHFGSKLRPSDRSFIISYVTQEANIEKHRFFPLIYKQSCVRRYKLHLNKEGFEERCHSYSEEDGTKISTRKTREIFYASHLDSMIYSYYASEVLGSLYEAKVRAIPKVNEAVLAYRKIEKRLGVGKGNADFAKEVFDRLRSCIAEHGNYAAIALDISAFFDTLNHSHLLKSWKQLNGLSEEERLPGDQYAVYKSLTDFSYVRLEDALEAIGIEHFRELRVKEPESFAPTYSDFRQRFAKRGKVKRHLFSEIDRQGKRTRRGIPQGTPVSAFLSNVYLLEFDEWACEILEKYGGYYRRYSDDIVILCEAQKVASILMQFFAEIKQAYFLTIQPSKTQVTVFRTVNDYIIPQCLSSGKCKPFQYLGFEFDGNQALIRQASISKFYRRMLTAVAIRCNRVKKIQRAKARALKPKNSLEGILFKGPLYSRYSYQGRRGHNRNYLHYAEDAAKTLDNPRIKKQLSRAWNVLNKKIKERI